MNSISIKCINSEITESGASHGQFLINSLKTGQGTTIGNHLRRNLLSELGGISISAVRIAGITHEFSTLPGVREDILEILLNLKGIILKSKTDCKDTQLGRLKIQGPSVVTASLIQLPSDLDIINSNHYIATISNSNILEIEFKFEYGTGYRLANQSFSNDDESYLQLDTIFMPVQKVDFTIERVHSADNRSLKGAVCEAGITERLLLDIWTNGSILPKDALELAIQNIIDLFSLLISKNTSNKMNSINQKDKSLSIEPYTNIAIEELQLSVRAYNCLKKAQINTVGDLLHYSPEKLQELKNFGRKSADEVFTTLKNKLGIILK